MNVAIDSHGGVNLVVALHTTDGDGNIVDHAESLAMVGKSMMEAAANVNGDAIGQSLARGQNRSACRQPDCLIGGWLRWEEVFGTGDSRLQQAVVDSAIFLSREDVSTDGKVILVAVN